LITAYKICYRFGDASVVYHEEEKDGLVKICRLAMYKKYPKYPTEGFEALYSRPPVIYVSASSKPGVSNYLCLQVSNFLFLFWDSAFVGLFREFISETIIDRYKSLDIQLKAFGTINSKKKIKIPYTFLICEI
jgi:hypothetical protein